MGLPVSLVRTSWAGVQLTSLVASSNRHSWGSMASMTVGPEHEAGTCAAKQSFIHPFTVGHIRERKYVPSGAIKGASVPKHPRTHCSSAADSV